MLCQVRWYIGGRRWYRCAELTFVVCDNTVCHDDEDEVGHGRLCKGVAFHTINLLNLFIFVTSMVQSAPPLSH